VFFFFFFFFLKKLVSLLVGARLLNLWLLNVRLGREHGRGLLAICLWDRRWPGVAAVRRGAAVIHHLDRVDFKKKRGGGGGEARKRQWRKDEQQERRTRGCHGSGSGVLGGDEFSLLSQSLRATVGFGPRLRGCRCRAVLRLGLQTCRKRQKRKQNASAGGFLSNLFLAVAAINKVKQVVRNKSDGILRPELHDLRNTKERRKKEKETRRKKEEERWREKTQRERER
jgi:hypothetical protein